MSTSPHSANTGARESEIDNDKSAHRPAATGGATAAHLSDRRSVVAREKDRYGGIKWGSAFFGWLTATGTAVIPLRIQDPQGRSRKGADPSNLIPH
ncbi:hypothetical protein [Actinoplanes friuliensis]|nr:hypothetical protein [Actinoplanes friuliensis]